MEDITEVCRLCLEKKTLVWIFDTRISVDDMKNIIYVTTGVEISSDDEVSQKVCSKCLQIAAKMYEFRLASQKSDSTLKISRDDKVSQKVCSKCLQLATKMYEFRMSSQKSDSTLKKKYKLYVGGSISNGSLNVNGNHPLSPNSKLTSEINKDIGKVAQKMHPSIMTIFSKHRKILIPTKCLRLNMLPVVSMTMNEVETYFAERNMDFQKHARQVLRSVRNLDSKNVEANGCGFKINNPENIECNSSKLDVVSPIKIATNKTGYTIISKSQPTGNAEDETKKIIHEVNSSKRKLSETETTVNKKVNTKNDTSALQIGQSLPLYVCNICNSVRHSLSALDKHKLKHFICQFCKTRFKSIEEKQQHLEKGCVVKKIKSSCLVEPQVELEKIELNPSIREKYPHAFVEFPPLPGMQVTKLNNENCSNKTYSNYEKHSINDNENKKTIDTSVTEIIDESETKSLAADHTKQKKILYKSPDVEKTPKVNANVYSSTSGEINKSLNSVSDPNVNIESDSSSKNNINTISTQEIVTSVSVVKPNVRIKNSSILDDIDPRASDIKLLRDLLTKCTNFSASLDQSTQTELLTSSIVHNEGTAEFKGLKHLLHYYKIPVVIKNGPFSVSYQCDNVEEKKGKMCLWDNLEPLDVAAPKISMTKKVPMDPNILRSSSDLTLLNSSHTENLVADPVTVATNCQRSEDVTLRKNQEDCQSGSSTVHQPSATLQLLAHKTTGEINVGESRASSADVLQSSAYSNNIVESSANNTHLAEISENSAIITETAGSSTKTVPHPMIQSAIPKLGQPISQPVDIFQTQVNTQDHRVTQASGSSVHCPVEQPERHPQTTINEPVNVPFLHQVASAKDCTLQAEVSSANINVGEIPIPAPGTIRVKSLTDLT